VVLGSGKVRRTLPRWLYRVEDVTMLSGEFIFDDCRLAATLAERAS